MSIIIVFCCLNVRKQERNTQIAFVAFSGSEKGDLLLRTHLSAVDRRIEACWYDLQIPVDAAALLESRDPDNCRRILSVTDRLWIRLTSDLPAVKRSTALWKGAGQSSKRLFTPSPIPILRW